MKGRILTHSHVNVERWLVRSQSLCTFFWPNLFQLQVQKTLFLFEVEKRVGKGEMSRKFKNMDAHFLAQTSAYDCIWINGGSAQYPLGS